MMKNIILNIFAFRTISLKLTVWLLAIGERNEETHCIINTLNIMFSASNPVAKKSI